MKTIKTGDELKKVLGSQKPTAIFYFMETCPHCIPMHKPWDELSREHPDVKFYKMERDNIPSEMGISGYPHFELVGNGPTRKVDGQMSKEDLKQKLFGTGGGRRLKMTGRVKRLRSRRLTRRRR